MAYIPKTCPYCGVNLDPGEKCECELKDRPDTITGAELRRMYQEVRGKFSPHDGEEGN